MATSSPAKRASHVERVPSPEATKLLAGEIPAQENYRDHRDEPREQHDDAANDIGERGIRGEPGERAAVVVRHRGKRVQYFGKPVRAGIGEPAFCLRQRDRDARCR